jgi:hypothetical protein
MMQIIEADTYDDYVVCRGFDPDSGRFLNSVNVGKPYGLRGNHPYNVGEVYAAVKPKTKLGDTPGKAATSAGHPADLDEAVEILNDDDGNPIAWLLLETGITLRWGKLSTTLDAGSTADVDLWQETGGGWGGWDEDSGQSWADVYAPPLMASGSIANGKWVLVGMVNGRKVVLLHQC